MSDAERLTQLEKAVCTLVELYELLETKNRILNDDVDKLRNELYQVRWPEDKVQ